MVKQKVGQQAHIRDNMSQPTAQHKKGIENNQAQVMIRYFFLKSNFDTALSPLPYFQIHYPIFLKKGVSVRKTKSQVEFKNTHLSFSFIYPHIIVFRQVRYSEKFSLKIFTDPSRWEIIGIAGDIQITHTVLFRQQKEQFAGFCSIMISSVFLINTISDMPHIVKAVIISDPQCTMPHNSSLPVADQK